MTELVRCRLCSPKRQALRALFSKPSRARASMPERHVVPDWEIHCRQRRTAFRAEKRRRRHAHGTGPKPVQHTGKSKELPLSRGPGWRPHTAGAACSKRAVAALIGHECLLGITGAHTGHTGEKDHGVIFFDLTQNPAIEDRLSHAQNRGTRDERRMLQPRESFFLCGFSSETTGHSLGASGQNIGRNLYHKKIRHHRGVYQENKTSLGSVSRK